MDENTRSAVIIPAKSCPCQQIVKLLPQLRSQDEIVVVANDLPDSKICELMRQLKKQIKWIDFPFLLGASKARNIGVNTINNTDIAMFFFTDADDEVPPNWLDVMKVPLVCKTADLVGGSILVNTPFRKSTVITPMSDYGYHQAVFGTSIGISRQAWTLLGGFDSNLNSCEDTDLSWRAINLGLRVRILPEAPVKSCLKPTLQELKQRFYWGLGSAHLLKKHGLADSSFPSLIAIIKDKQSSGFATFPFTAALAQWFGQCMGRFK